MALDAKRLAGDFGFAIVAQVSAMAVGFVNALLLPKLFSEVTYGYWQLFLFYATYCGVFAFGIVDGVYLIHGGERRGDMDKRAINAQFWCCMAVQAVVCAILLAVGFAARSDADRAAVIIGIALYLVLFNAANFLGYLFQAMGETRRYSVSTIVESVAFLFMMLALLAADVRTFEPYVAAYLLSRAGRLGYCALFARDFLGAGLLSLKAAVRASWSTAGVGVKLLVSTLSGSFIVGVARFVIDLQWSIEEFAVVSLALSLVNFFMTFTSQAAMVLFPALRRIGSGELVELYLQMRDGISLLLPAVYVLYAPIVFLLELWLPAYSTSFELFALLLPLCVFNGKMDVVGITFLKVLRQEGRLLRMNLTTLALSAAGAVVGGFALHSIDAIMTWSVACVIGRCLYADHFVSKSLSLPDGAINVGAVVMTVVAILANSLLGFAWAEIVIISAYLVYLVAFKDETQRLFGSVQGIGRS